MIDMKLSKVGANFLDQPHVKKKVKKSQLRVMNRQGALVRRLAQRSMRPGGVADKSSEPGEPPRTHGKRLLRKFLFYAYDPRKESVVIGPVRLSRAKGKHVPSTLEFGGRTTSRGKTRKYKPRPYMGPAFETAKPELPQMWRNSVR